MLNNILCKHISKVLGYRCLDFGMIGYDYTTKIIVKRPYGPQTVMILKIYKNNTIGIVVNKGDMSAELNKTEVSLHLADPDFFDKLKTVLPPISKFKVWWYAILEALQGDTSEYWGC